MKKKISKLFGVGLAVILLTSLFGFATPVSAAAPLPTINAWDTFDYPVAGGLGGWFWDPTITELGPMDKALNGDIYIYAKTGGVLYGADGAGGNPCNLYLLDPNSGAVLRNIGPIADAGGQFAVTGLAFDPITGTLYGVTGRNAAYNPMCLITINPATGAGTLVGPLNIAGEGVADISFDAAGVLYGWIEPGTDSLCTINTGTGQATLVGPSGLNTYGSGLAFDPSGTLWFAGEGDSWWAGYGNLYAIDPATSLPTYAAPLDGTAAWPIGGLACDGDGCLYGARKLIGWGPGCLCDLITINTTTGHITSLGPTVAGLDAIAFGPPTEVHMILRSTDGGRSWTDSISPLKYFGGEVVDMVCSGMYEDVIYLTDGNYVYKSSDNADTWAIVGQADLEKILMGACGVPVTCNPITCLDVGYDAANKPYIFIGVTTTFDPDGPDDVMGTADDDAVGFPTGPADILWIDETAIGATWLALDLSCYSCGGFTPYAVGVTPDFATGPVKLMAVVTSPYTMNFNLDAVGVVTVTDIPDGVNSVIDFSALPAEVTGPGASPFTIPDTTAVTFTCNGTGTGCASVCLDIETGTALVRVTTAGATLGSTHVVSSNLGVCGWAEVAELVKDCNPASAVNHFQINHSSRIGYPDDYTDARMLFVGVTSVSDWADGTGNLVTSAGLPADGRTEGGDVYSVGTFPVGVATDLNVAGSFGGCVGKTVGTNICGLDVCGDTADAAVIAGAMNANLDLNGPTDVFTSIDGGWTWSTSLKDPSGAGETWVQWIGADCAASALAATLGCDCAVSITCGPDTGLYWNQASLINTCIDCVLVVDHSPGYYQAGTSDTFFMLTHCNDCCNDQHCFSVFRYVGDPTMAGTSSPAHPWDRVFSSILYAIEIDDAAVLGVDRICFLEVSPDFGTTEAVFIGNNAFEIWRSLDAGCSWFKFAYPCAPRPMISAMTVVDKETVVTGGQDATGTTTVWKTTRHGTRPFSAAPIKAGIANTWPTSFDFVGNNFVMGDDNSQVFLSSDGAMTFAQVDGALDATGYMTSVIFDPGYAVTGNPGENVIYAAADDDIYRCTIDPTLPMPLQTWDTIFTNDPSVFWGMAVTGDTALYVGDRTAGNGMWRSLNPLAPLLPVPNPCEFEVANRGLALTDNLTSLNNVPFPFQAYNCGMPLTSGVNGCPDSNVLWAVDRCSTGTRVWFFEDTLARQVDLTSPANGAKGLSAVIGTTTATIEWEALCGATCYEKEVWYFCPGCDVKTMLPGFPECFDCAVVPPCVGCSGQTCCEVILGLEPGVTYYWRVRVGGVPGTCGAGCPMLSKWSDTWSFTTALTVPVRCSPICGAEDITLTPNFSWSETPGATGYEIEVSLSEDFDTLLASGTPTINAWDGIPQLEYGTTYYWRVRAVKDGTVGAWTYCLFSTEEAPPEAPPQVWVCPQCGLTFTSEAALQAHIDAEHAPPETPFYIWVIIGIGAALVIAVIILIVMTRRVA